METTALLSTLVAVSALIPALVGTAARAPRLLAEPIRRLRKPLLVVLMLMAGLRAPVSAATPLPTERLETEVDPVPDGVPDPVVAETLPTRAYVVQSGDSLWAIACRTLSPQRGSDPADEEVDRLWKVIYQANRDLVGPDPDLIFPGQHLVLPEEV